MVDRRGDAVRCQGGRRSRRASASGWVVCVALAVALAGCGTTVPVDAQSLSAGDATRSSGTSDGGLGPSSAELGQDPASLSEGSSAPRGEGGADGRSPEAPRSGGSGPLTPSGNDGASTRPGTDTEDAAAPAPGRAIQNGKGISGDKVKIGFIIASGSPGGAFGASLAYNEDTNTRIVKAYVEEINATGGVAGRTVVPAFAYIDNTDQSEGTQTRLQNEACVAMTEDAGVFAAIALQPQGIVYAYDCFARHKTPLIDATLAGTEQHRMEELYPWLVAPVYMNSTRMARVLPEALRQQGFLTQKMAILSYDRPDLVSSAKKVLVPELNRLGGKVVDEVYMQSTYEGLSSGTAAAALKFKNNGVDRVVMWAPGGGALIFFARQAESQNYRPRYGISTYDAPALVQTTLGAAAPEQLKGAMGAGFIRSSDMADAQSGPLNAREKACFDVVRKRAGLSYTSRRQPNSAAGYALATCELTRFLKASLESRIGTPVAQADLGAEVARLGRSYLPVVIPASSFDRRKMDGAAVYHQLLFSDDCDCFKYRGSSRPVPN
jgi:ABC-type branched-subunit amino acid transport system substrate-binding protein